MTVTLARTSEVTESRTLGEATNALQTNGRMKVLLISVGWGSSGYYSAEALKQAATDRIFPAGTHMYLDHPTASENWERPERSVKDLAAVLETDATWDESQQGLVAEARVFAAWRQAIADLAESIGVSIRASAEVEPGTAEGRNGILITALHEGISADFVTHAGRGGKILQVIESARATGRAISRGVAEATANDRRSELDALVKAAWSGEQQWAWIRDFDDETVWYEVETPDSAGLFQQGYTTTDDAADALTGDPVPVRVQVQYVPVTAGDPDGGTQTTVTSADEADNEPSQAVRSEESTATTSEEDTMAKIQIEESELSTLRADAGRATTLESELAEARRERAAAEEALRRSVEEADAAKVDAIIAEAEEPFDALQVAGLKAQAPVDESGRVKLDEFKQLVEAEAAKIAAARGAGAVRGVGHTAAPNPTGTVSESDVNDAVARAFGRRTSKEA